jgi:hypothetical protein
VAFLHCERVNAPGGREGHLDEVLEAVNLKVACLWLTYGHGAQLLMGQLSSRVASCAIQAARFFIVALRLDWGGALSRASMLVRAMISPILRVKMFQFIGATSSGAPKKATRSGNGRFDFRGSGMTITRSR